jgi:hypothetical protein
MDNGVQSLRQEILERVPQGALPASRYQQIRVLQLEIYGKDAKRLEMADSLILEE